MKRITAFVGSARRKHTYDAVVQFLRHLQALGDVEYEIVSLSDYTLKACRGCCQCVEKGEAFCPLKDDRDVLMDKIMASDGVVLASPNYCGQVSGIMKVFIDRFVFACHRPRHFGRACTSIVTQSINGGSHIVEYLDTLAMALGFTVVKGTCVTPVDPMTEERQRKIDRALSDQARRFHAGLAKAGYPAPTWLKLMLFRVGRNTIRQMFDESSCDYRYYTERGWFESEYYYPTRLGPLKKLAGRLIDAMAPTWLRMLA
ncbi:MAG: flavodoxin family protein [Anaerolineae bacterium]|nr:flavodoxin family protein [Anaerolineae bacterium]